jgi:hypothetical protein
MLMLTDTELTDILFRVDNDMDNWRDRAKLRQHIEAQAQTIASLRAEVDARKQQTQAPAGWHRLFVATPTLPVEISVNGVPVPLNGHEADEVGA